MFNKKTRQILFTTILVFLVLCFSSCSNSSINNKEDNVPQKDNIKAEYIPFEDEKDKGTVPPSDFNLQIEKFEFIKGSKNGFGYTYLIPYEFNKEMLKKNITSPFVFCGRLKDGVPDGKGMLVITDGYEDACYGVYMQGKEIKMLYEKGFLLQTGNIMTMDMMPGDFKYVEWHRGSFVNGYYELVTTTTDNIYTKMYVGELDDEYPTGKGSIFDECGDKKTNLVMLISECEYNEGSMTGKGKTYYANGQIEYIGEYEDGGREGDGIVYYPNGNIQYDGEFENDMREGEGTLYYSNGNICYEGEFKNGKPDGDGVFYEKNGNIQYDGEFKNGKAIDGSVDDFLIEMLLQEDPDFLSKEDEKQNIKNNINQDAIQTEAVKPDFSEKKSIDVKNTSNEDTMTDAEGLYYLLGLYPDDIASEIGYWDESSSSQGINYFDYNKYQFTLFVNEHEGWISRISTWNPEINILGISAGYSEDNLNSISFAPLNIANDPDAFETGASYYSYKHPDFDLVVVYVVQNGIVEYIACMKEYTYYNMWYSK